MESSKDFITRVLKAIRNKSGKDWLKIEKKEVLSLFQAAAKRVPAYKDFLRKNKVNPEKIKTLSDFSLIPSVTKENYLKVYPYEKLFWDGNIKKPLTIHSTSGSTGEPTYFQREFRFDLRREAIIQNFFTANNLTTSGPTLFIITFGMGVWSAGMGIYTAAYLAVNHYNLPISIVTPGVSKIEVIKILRKLAPNYKQIIIAGYPPFVKDVIDDARHEGVDVRKLNLRFVFTGEAFPEEFRDYLSSKAGVRNLYLDTMNTYGTSEFGATAVETPLGILARRLSQKNSEIFKGLFGNITKTPTVAQYIPYFVNFECKNGELFLTGDGPIPLVKYESGDHGGILNHHQVEETLAINGISLSDESKRLGISNYPYKLPFVYIYERKNLTASLYGILIYPEFIKTALFDKRVNDFLTGKFTMMIKYSKQQDQFLEINLEMRRGIKSKIEYEKLALRVILDHLRQKSSEFRELSNNMKEKVFPKLVFWSYEDPLYFTLGTKQKWVAKEKIRA